MMTPRGNPTWHQFGTLLGLLVLGCGGAQPAAAAPISDTRSVFLQEAGELPAQAGPCPERSEPDVLRNPRAAVSRTAFGLAYCVLEEGPEGKTAPLPTDTVRVHYTGWTEAGEQFDSSRDRGEPIEFALNQVIRGWSEGLVRLTPGDKARLWIPGRLGYGPRKPGEPAGTPPKGTLIFDVELIEVIASAAPPPKPSGSPSASKPSKTNP
jgi:hypothetical protein